MRVTISNHQDFDGTVYTSCNVYCGEGIVYHVYFPGLYTDDKHPELENCQCNMELF